MSGSYCKSLTFMPHHLDVAVISYKFNELRQQGEDDHVVDLDPINISEADFKRLFYYTHHNHNTFAVNRQYPAGQEAKFYGYVSFAEQSIDNVLFNLGDEILDNIEADLGISRHMLSTCSLINLTKELNSLKTLRDFPQSNVTCSLKWSDIVQTLRSRFRRDAQEPSDNYDKDDGYISTGGTVTYEATVGGSLQVVTRRVIPESASNSSKGGFEYFFVDTYGTEHVFTPAEVTRTVEDYDVDTNVPVILSISVQFITPNEGVAPTIVKFNYATTVDVTLNEKC
jgi:hypothetical protein